MNPFKKDKFYKIRKCVEPDSLRKIGFASSRIKEMLQGEIKFKFCGKFDETKYYFQASDKFYNRFNDLGDHWFFADMLEPIEKEKNHPLTGIFK